MSKARIEKKKSAFKTVSPINIKRTSENKIKSQILQEREESQKIKNHCSS